MTWVRFHDEFLEPEWRGFSRATRFIYMELSHEALEHRGWIEFPVSWSDIQCMHDTLRGNRREVVVALQALTAGSSPKIRFEVRGRVRALVVVDWEKRNPLSDVFPKLLHRRVIERDGFVCGLCGGAVVPTDVHIDHVIPASKGGPTVEDNLQVTHSICNMRKGNRAPGVS